MDINAIFDLQTLLFMLLLYTITFSWWARQGIMDFVHHCLRFRQRRKLSEEEIREQLRELHVLLCRARGLRPSKDLNALPECSQFKLMLDLSEITKEGGLILRYEPWKCCAGPNYEEIEEC